MSTSCRVLIDLVTQLTREVDRLGSTVARLKLKGIDGDPHKRWMMWINSMQREKTLPTLDMSGIPERLGSARKRIRTQVLHGCRQLVS